MRFSLYTAGYFAIGVVSFATGNSESDFFERWGFEATEAFIGQRGSQSFHFLRFQYFFFNENRIIALGMHFKHLIIKVEGWCTLLSCTSMTVCVPLFGNNSVNPSLM